MCGIVGITHKGKTEDIGSEMTRMLQSLKHQGPDSTGFGLYGKPEKGNIVMRIKVAEQEDMRRSLDIHRKVKDRWEEVEERLSDMGAKIVEHEASTEYAFLYRLQYEGDLKKLADTVEEVEGGEILSLGNSLELIKDLGDAQTVSTQYSLEGFQGTHAIGHVRMATESDVDISSAHPFWAYPFCDISVVHNGQLTNYWTKRRELERRGYRFKSNCDSELLAVYVAHKLDKGETLEKALQESIKEIDGVFTYVIATSDSIGMAKDVMAAKPMVVYEGEDCVILASEEVAIRSVIPHEIDSYDPYAGEVKVWKN